MAMKFNLENESSSRLVKIILYIMLFIFVLPNQLRVGILGSRLGKINFIAIILILYIVFKHTKRFYPAYIIAWFCISIYFIGSSFFYQKNIIEIVYSYGAYILPLCLIGMRLTKEEFIKIFKVFIIIFNSIILLITLIGIIDYFIGNKIILFISRFMTERINELITIQQYQDIHRMYSFMGHPLFNTQLYIMFFVINILYKKYVGNIIPMYVVYLVSIIGVALTASKSGLILLVLSMIIVTTKKNKLLWWIIISLMVYISIKLGVFNNTILRLKSGSLTTGRNETWEIIKNNNIYPFKFFIGYGNGFTFNYNNFVKWASAAFEYPILMFSLELGIYSTMIMYCLIFIYPVCILLKRNKFLILYAYLIVFIDVNTYNGLSVIGDNMLILSIFIFILLNLSRYIDKKYKCD